MPLFQNILVVADVQDKHHRALYRAIKLAKQNGARLTVATVVDQLPTFWQMVIEQEYSADNPLVQTRKVELQKLVESVESDRIQVTTKVLQGRPAIEIVNEVLQHGHDLVLKNAFAREDPAPLFFGSVDLRLLRNCPCPVWLVKPMPSRPFERVVAAIDPFPDSAEEMDLNQRLLEVANSVAIADGAALYVVGAWSAYGESLLAGRVSFGSLVDYIDEFSQRGEQYLAKLLKNTDITLHRDCMRYKQGSPDRVICEQVNSLQADLLVMGTLSRTGIKGLLMGNTAEKVLRQVECSVLTLKPGSFLSPMDSRAA